MDALSSPLEILYADDRLLAINKPSALAVHRGWSDDDVVAMTLARDQIGRHVYPVHRLDRATSGVLLFALDPECARNIQELFQRGEVRKTYRALVRGVPPEQLSIDHPIPNSEDGPRVDAQTELRRLFAWERRYAWIEALPKTGRLHQVRRHLKHISHPIIGDVRYGKGEHNRFFRSTYGLHRLALHALQLELPHPETGARISLTARIPPDLREPLLGFGLPERFLI